MVLKLYKFLSLKSFVFNAFQVAKVMFGQVKTFYTYKQNLIMKYIFLTIFLINISFLKSFSQDTFKIQYDYNEPTGTREVFTLETNGVHSKFSFLELKKIDPGVILEGNYDEDFFMYKNFIDSTIYCRADFFSKKFYLKDSLFNIKWQLLNSSKLILGYLCYEAVAEFRGRTFKAFYTPNIPYPDGPWKFSGLPGLILEVSTDDNKFSYIALSISISNKFTKREDISKYKFILYSELCFQIRKIFENLIIAMKADSEPGTSCTLKITKLEIIDPRFQLGDGYAY